MTHFLAVTVQKATNVLLTLKMASNSPAKKRRKRQHLLSQLLPAQVNQYYTLTYLLVSKCVVEFN